MPTVIHPTAIVEPGAVLGEECEIMAHAIVTRHCTLGARVVVHPFAVIGGDPQYLKFDRATDSRVVVGEGSVLREHVTVNLFNPRGRRHPSRRRVLPHGLQSRGARLQPR
jgi:UDP-N-acetylglucosamine acyltransferase